jgi:hypothetical protein
MLEPSGFLREGSTLKYSVPRRPARSFGSLLLATFAIRRSPEKIRRPSHRSASPSVSTTRRLSTSTVVALAGASLLAVTGTQAIGTVAATARPAQESGFSIPFSGPERYEYLAPTQATNPRQINQRIGQKNADKIARKLGLKKKYTLTEEQYLKFISGQGVGGRTWAAKLADKSVRIFTNTRGRPLVYFDAEGNPVRSVLASYGLFVNEQGLLQSLANPDAPTRKANILLIPGGYIDRWFKHNGASAALDQLHSSAYRVEAAFGSAAQGQSDPWQLVTNTKPGASTQVGMSMAPALWLTNFALLYTLKPAVAAKMPAYWAPIPTPVADAILDTDSGQVPYSEYASYFR